MTSQDNAAHPVAVLALEGLTCGSCVASVKAALEAIEGVELADVGLLPEPKAAVRYRLGALKPEKLVEEIQAIGFDATIVESTKLHIVVRRPPLFTPLEGRSVTISKMTTTTANDEDGNGRYKIEYISSDFMRGPREVLEYVFPDITLEEMGAIFVEASTTTESRISEMERGKNQEKAEWRRRFLVSLVFVIPIFVVSMILGMSHMNKMDDEAKTYWLHRRLPGWMLHIQLEDAILLPLASVVQFWCGGIFYREAFRALFRRGGSMGMAFLIASGSTAAYAYSVFATLHDGITYGNANHHHHDKNNNNEALRQTYETPSMLIMFVLLGKYLEAAVKGSTSEAIVRLGKTAPSSALLVVRRGGGEETREIRLPVGLIAKGDVVRIPPGESIPVDGEVLEGVTHVDESAVTGESLPKEKREGDRVFVSTLNLGGSVLVRVEASGEDSSLARILDVMQRAQASKTTETERFAERVVKIFAPTVVLLALLTFLSWTVYLEIGHHASLIEEENPSSPLAFALLSAVKVLVIACPCALGLATPAAVMVASGVLARHGLLLKDGAALETLARTKAVVFDKTGTLTLGTPRVGMVRVSTSNRVAHEKVIVVNEAFVLSIAASAERFSQHPMAKAITNSASSIDYFPALNVKETFGFGVECEMDIFGSRSAIYVGKPREGDLEAATYERMGYTVVVVELAGSALGHVCLMDVARSEARELINALTGMGIECYMMTGDNFSVAHAVGSEVGIPASRIIAKCLPQDKAVRIEELKRVLREPRRRKSSDGVGSRSSRWFWDLCRVHSFQRWSHAESLDAVVMVGDGVNDAPALTVADAGVAVGSGMDVAMESAQLVLMSTDLTQVFTAVHFARVVRRRIALNLFFALAYNAIMIPYAAGIFYGVSHSTLPPYLASACMSLSSVSVVLSSLHLKRYRRPSLVTSNAETNLAEGTGSASRPLLAAQESSPIKKRGVPECSMRSTGVCTCEKFKCVCRDCCHTEEIGGRGAKHLDDVESGGRIAG